MRSKVDCVDGVHADRDPAQPGSRQGSGHFGQKVSIGSDGKVQRLTGRLGTQLGKLRQQGHKALAQKGLASGQADFFDAQGDEDADDPQVVIHGQFGKLSTLGAGAAINTLVVAAIGNGYAQV